MLRGLYEWGTDGEVFVLADNDGAGVAAPAPKRAIPTLGQSEVEDMLTSF